MAQFRYQVGDETKVVRVERVGDQFAVTVDDRSYTVHSAHAVSARLVMQLAEQHVTAVVAPVGQRNDQQLAVWLEGESWRLHRLTAPPRRQVTAHTTATDSITAPMPGQVLALLVTVGAPVATGDLLVVLGAMKMETRIVAPHAGVVAALGCAVGDTVARGQVLVELAPNDAPPGPPA